MIITVTVVMVVAARCPGRRASGGRGRSAPPPSSSAPPATTSVSTKSSRSAPGTHTQRHLAVVYPTQFWLKFVFALRRSATAQVATVKKFCNFLWNGAIFICQSNWNFNSIRWNCLNLIEVIPIVRDFLAPLAAERANQLMGQRHWRNWLINY